MGASFRSLVIAGLDRQSIISAKTLLAMDARVKPAHDDLWTIDIPKQKGPGKTGAFEIAAHKTDQRE
jgi:hypothetical protein